MLYFTVPVQAVNTFHVNVLLSTLFLQSHYFVYYFKYLL